MALFPGDPILERHLASAQRRGEQRRATEPVPPSAAETVAELEEPASAGEAEPAVACPLAAPRPTPAARRFPKVVVAVCGALSLLTAGAIWDHSRGKTPLNASVAGRVSERTAP